jgi:hypothetical protein
MPDTLLGFGLAIALVLPGFVIADLAETRRATRSARSDLELVLRGLVYALLLQGAVAATGWTAQLVNDLDGDDAWKNHLEAIAAFALVVGVLIPTVAGLTLSWWLRRAEQAGQLRPWHYALGGRDHREAWDYVFGRRQGTYLLFTFAGSDGPKHMLAKYGRGSWASQAPTRPQEIYVEEVWPADADGIVDEAALQRVPKRGMWISVESVERLEILHLSAVGSDD